MTHALPLLFKFVPGVAAPKGSKEARGRAKNGRVIMVESSKRVAPWSAAVSCALLDRSGRPMAHFPGAAKVTLEFVMVRPAYLDKGKRPLPTPRHTKRTGGDVDKLARCVLDSITVAGVWNDDCQACELIAMKRYAERGEPTGCTILIEALPEPEMEIPNGQAKTERKQRNGERRGRGDGAGQPALAL